VEKGFNCLEITLISIIIDKDSKELYRITFLQSLGNFFRA